MTTTIPEPWAELAAEIGADKRDWGTWGPDVNSLIFLAVEELRRRNRDAVRYRWLRDNNRLGGGLCYVEIVSETDRNTAYCYGGTSTTTLSMDQAIDAAMVTYPSKTP